MKRKINDRQLTLDFASLFEIPSPKDPTAGSMDCALELRHLISDTLKKCPKSRFVIAGEMSQLTGRDITKAMLDSWAAESREGWRFPFEFSIAFEAATETYVLTEFLARKRGCKVFAGEDLYAAELGKLETLKTEISEKIKMLKKHMGEQRKNG